MSIDDQRKALGLPPLSDSEEESPIAPPLKVVKGTHTPDSGGGGSMNLSPPEDDEEPEEDPDEDPENDNEKLSDGWILFMTFVLGVVVTVVFNWAIGAFSSFGDKVELESYRDCNQVQIDHEILKFKCDVSGLNECYREVSYKVESLEECRGDTRRLKGKLFDLVNEKNTPD